MHISSRKCLSCKTKLLQNKSLCLEDFLSLISEVKGVNIEYLLGLDPACFPSPLYIIDYSHHIFDLPRGFLNFGRNEECRCGHSDQVTAKEGFSKVKSMQEGLRGRDSNLGEPKQDARILDKRAGKGTEGTLLS